MAFDKVRQKKLLKKLKAYLNADAKDLRKQDDGLLKVLKKLKKKEHHLNELISAETDIDERKDLEQELKVLRSQRKKGIKLLAEVRDKKRH